MRSLEPLARDLAAAQVPREALDVAVRAWIGRVTNGNAPDTAPMPAAVARAQNPGMDPRSWVRWYSIMVAVAASAATMHAAADCTWEWLCNGEAQCKQMPICDSVRATRRRPSRTSYGATSNDWIPADTGMTALSILYRVVT